MTENTEDSVGAGPPRRAWPVFFLLALAVVSLLLHVIKSNHHKKLLAVKQRTVEIVRDPPLENVKEQRSRFYQIEYYLNYPAAASYAVADFVRRLCWVFPPRQVHSLEIEPGLQDFSFRMVLGINAGSTGNARRAAAARLEALRKFPEVTRVAFADVDPHAASGAGDRVYFFVVTGQADMP